MPAELAEEVQAETYLGEKYTKYIPRKQGGQWRTDSDEESEPIILKAMNHMALDVFDVETMARCEDSDRSSAAWPRVSCLSGA